VPAALVEHLFDRARRDVKEAGQVDRGQSVEVLKRVVRERLADVEAGVVDQGVDPTETLDRRVHDALRGVRIRDVALDGNDAGVF
jgi:hypothetical protein